MIEKAIYYVTLVQQSRIKTRFDWNKNLATLPFATQGRNKTRRVRKLV